MIRLKKKKNVSDSTFSTRNYLLKKILETRKYLKFTKDLQTFLKKKKTIQNSKRLLQ